MCEIDLPDIYKFVLEQPYHGHLHDTFVPMGHGCLFYLMRCPLCHIIVFVVSHTFQNNGGN